MATWPAKTNYATGDVLTAAEMQDIGNALNSVGSAQYAAGKNKIINGDFGIWQRGTSFTNNTNSLFAFTTDRFIVANNNGGTVITSRQTFTPGSAPVPGYEGKYFMRINSSVAGTGNRYIIHQIEDVQTLAGQTATFSFWAKANANLTTSAASLYADQIFGSGGSTGVGTSIPSSSFTVTTSWQRYSFTVAIPSISGKTVGTSSHLDIVWTLPDSLGTFTLDTWGWQLEAGSVATPFQTATGTLAGELAAASRYYYRYTTSVAYTTFAQGGVANSTNARFNIQLPVQMRVAPSAVDYSTLGVAETGASVIAATNVIIDNASPSTVNLIATVASGLTQYRSCNLYTNNSTAAFLGFSAEL